MTIKSILNPSFLPLLPMLLLLGLLTACHGTRSEGDMVTEFRSANDFHALNIEVPGQIVLHTGPKYEVEVNGEETIMPYLETVVKNGELHVCFSKPVYDVDDLNIHITAPALDEIYLSGSGDVSATQLLDGTTLKVRVSGSGDIVLSDVRYDYIEVEISGSGQADLAGAAEKSLEYKVSGSGDADGFDCPSPRVEARVSGSGSVRCHAIEYLKATVSGSGDVWYIGSPSVDADVSGSGKVRKL